MRARSRPRVRGDLLAAGLLAGLFLGVVAVTWRRWGVPELDAGAELTTADLVGRGARAYGDVRYFYGPLGLYGLAGLFRVFGASLTTAYAFGLVQTAAILGTFYALARRWLRPTVAGIATAMLLAIAFSGTAYDFVLPHTNSATTGLLALLAMLLALSHGRPFAAGVAAGLVGLTRPEYVAVAAGITVAYLVGVAWERRGGVARAAVRLAVPALVIPVVVLGLFAASVGTGRLLTENLWPVAFLRVVGFSTQSYWMPFDAPSAAGLLLRGFVYGALLAAVVATAVRLDRERHARSLWPLAAAAGAIAALDAALRAAGVLAFQRTAIEDETGRLLLGMSWLPMLGFAAGAWMLAARARGRPSPLGRGWAADLALVAAAAALGLRAYNAFTPEASYAAYYAAPLVLLLGILHERVGDQWPAARTASAAVLAVVAAGLMAHAQFGLYDDRSALVQTARGSFRTTPAAAAALAPTLRQVQALSRPGERILAGPADGGLYFLADRRPALYEVMLLPGLLEGPADERAALATLRGEGVRVAVVAARDFTVWGWPRFGVDYDRTLGDGLRQMTVASRSFGSAGDPAAGTYPSRGFDVLLLDANASGERTVQDPLMARRP